MKKSSVLLGIFALVIGLNLHSHAQTQNSTTSRLSQLVEANVIAVHAYQILLAKKSGKGDPSCYSSGNLTEAQLENLSEHQGKLLKSDLQAVKAWANGTTSSFDPSQDLEPILKSAIKVPEKAPVNIFTDYLLKATKADPLHVRSVAKLYQTVLEVERDGDRLQEEYAFYIGLGLPVYVGQFNLPGTDQALLDVGRQLEGKACESP